MPRIFYFFNSFIDNMPTSVTQWGACREPQDGMGVTDSGSFPRKLFLHIILFSPSICTKIFYPKLVTRQTCFTTNHFPDMPPPPPIRVYLNKESATKSYKLFLYFPSLRRSLKNYVRRRGYTTCITLPLTYVVRTRIYKLIWYLTYLRIGMYMRTRIMLCSLLTLRIAVVQSFHKTQSAISEIKCWR